MDPSRPTESPAPEAQRQGFPCPSCGGQLHWDPGVTSLKCPFCGSAVSVPGAEGARAQEHDLMAFLDQHPMAEGYGVPLDTLACRSCGAKAKIPPGRRDMACPFCGTTYVFEAQNAPEQVIKPESVIPFRVSHEQCRERFRAWLGGGWFRPGDLQKLGSLDRIIGIYMPFFTFDAQADSAWTAEAGFYYNVVERVAVNRNGRSELEDRQVRKVRWEPAAGQRTDAYDDVLVPAVAQQRLDLMKRVYPFDTQAPEPYDTRFLSGFAVLNAERPLKEVYEEARAIMEAEQQRRCAGDVPGDTQRNLQVQTQLRGQTFKHLMCPLWVGSFNYKGKVFTFVINGQSGALYGEKPWSVPKIAGFVALLLLAVVLFLLFRG